MLEFIVREINADSAAIMVPNVKKRFIYCYQSYNMPPEWVAIKNAFSEKALGGTAQVYKTGSPAITNHLNKELKGYYIESVMVVPIMRKGKTIAMLELVHSSKGKTFTERDLQTAQSFAKELDSKLSEALT